MRGKECRKSEGKGERRGKTDEESERGHERQKDREIGGIEKMRKGG